MADDTPWISLNPAGFWVCVGCGSENYVKFTAVENPDEHPEGADPDSEITRMPKLVTCVSCDEEFSTVSPTDGPHPVGYLDDLRDLIDALAHGSKRRRKGALQFIQEHHDTFIAAISWAMEKASKQLDDDD